MSQISSTVRALIIPVLVGLCLALAGLLYQSHQSAKVPVVVEVSSAPANRTAPSLPGSFRNAVKQAAPAVVNITTPTRSLADDHPLLSDPLLSSFVLGNSGNGGLIPLGSGVIISQAGHILTNHHVIADKPTLVVELQDGRQTRAAWVGSDPESDLAVLQIALPDVPVMAIASEKPEVGDTVLAIGNPFGVGQSVSQGILSATGRIAGLVSFENFYQTDAAINPGNSGGALTNVFGELIGINSAIFTRNGGSQGIGFAIPTSLALSVMEQLITRGRVIRGFLGIEATPIQEELREAFGGIDGLAITSVSRGSPAELAGLLPGDLLVEINGQPVRDGRAAMLQITDMKPGQQADLGVLRQGERLDYDVTIGIRPQVSGG